MNKLKGYFTVMIHHPKASEKYKESEQENNHISKEELFPVDVSSTPSAWFT